MAVWPLPRITFRELSSVEETRPVALLTTDAVWAVLSTQLTLPVMIQAEPVRYDRELFDYLADNLPSQVRAIYAVGGGAPVEAGKLIAARNHVPLIIVPTALDSLHMLMPVAHMLRVENDHGVIESEETGPAAEIVIDWNVIQSAPKALRGAGIVDVLSVITGLLDWRHAAQKGKNPREQRFESWAASVASDLAKQALKSAAAVGQGHRDALHTLLNLMLMVTQLNNQLQHSRAQQGSEHYLAHALHAMTQFRTPHASTVGQCLLFAAVLHGHDPAPMRVAMEQAGVPFDVVRPTDFALLMEHLDAYLTEYEFPYSVLNEMEPDSAQMQQALEVAGLVVPPETWEQPEAVPADAEEIENEIDFSYTEDVEDTGAEPASWMDDSRPVEPADD